MKNGYFIGNINPTFSDKPIFLSDYHAHSCWVCLKIVYPYTQWLMIIIPTKWLFHWGYTPFSDIPCWFSNGQTMDLLCSDQDTLWPSSTGCSSPPFQTLSPTSFGAGWTPETVGEFGEKHGVVVVEVTSLPLSSDAFLGWKQSFEWEIVTNWMQVPLKCGH